MLSFTGNVDEPVFTLTTHCLCSFSECCENLSLFSRQVVTTESNTDLAAQGNSLNGCTIYNDTGQSSSFIRHSSFNLQAATQPIPDKVPVVHFMTKTESD